tara:strand:+ start:633 stop:899 length:267 start_codon:yes stop_codon:yes gene_type:complete
VKKYRLYTSSSGWNNRHASLKTHLGIPNGFGTTEYAPMREVGNSENADFGKFIMPVMTSGRWKCEDQFNPSNLVDFDPTWNIPPPIGS